MIVLQDEFKNVKSEELKENDLDRCNRAIELYTEKVIDLLDILSTLCEKDSKIDEVRENIYDLVQETSDCGAILRSLLAYRKLLTANNMSQQELDELKRTDNHIRLFLYELYDDNISAVHRLIE